jgi:Tfp pilus assembly protein PilX
MHARENMDMRRNRAGFALPVAVFALVIVGVLVTGGFYMARQETRIGTASQNSAAAFYLAERGIYNTLANWNNPTMSAVGTWNTTTLTGTGTDGTYSVTVMPMTSRLYFLQSTGTVSKGGALWSGATRQVGMIARINTANMDPPAALTTIGALKFGGNAQIDGRDTDPSGWPSSLCTTNNVNKSGVMMTDTTLIDWSGNETTIRTQQLNGSSDLAQNSTMSIGSLTTFGDMTWSDLTGMATKKYNTAPSNPAPTPSALTLTGSCTETASNNWGYPLNQAHPCFNFFPIIWLNNAGQTWNFSGGAGQGILLVEGNLKVTGDFQFYGPIYIKGRIETAGGGGVQHFHGGMVAANAQLEQNSVLGTADIVYSSCAVDRAITNNPALTRAKPLAQRSWVDLSAIAY